MEADVDQQLPCSASQSESGGFDESIEEELKPLMASPLEQMGRYSNENTLNVEYTQTVRYVWVGLTLGG